MSNSEDIRPSLELIIHDLRGPLTNIEGFYSELKISIDQLLEIMNEHHGLLPDHVNETINSIVQDDVNPCFKYSHTMIEALKGRIDKLKGTSLE